MILSLGHSTLPKDDFVDACHAANVDTIIDVRSHPGSAAHPHFGKASMTRWLKKANIGYEWWPGLGGWTDRHAPLATQFVDKDVEILPYCNNAFPRQRISKPCPHGFSCYGFHDFQWFQTLDEYKNSVEALIPRRNANICMICCEAKWWECHRAMVADTLGVLGIEVQHIIPRFRKIKLPRAVTSLTGHGKFLADRLTRYDFRVIESWHSIRT